ncbi:MAG: hypothetical protein DRJ40_06545 [Thermoprotei archaeon]|nr:MAG: hypothetical protein DRJ40_06545 [Thermoprotei archaeon]
MSTQVQKRDLNELRRLIVEYLLAELKAQGIHRPVSLRKVQKLLALALFARYRDGKFVLEVSSLAKLFDFRVSRYGPFSKVVSDILTKYFLVKRESDEAGVSLVMTTRSREEVLHDLESTAEKLGLTREVRDLVERITDAVKRRGMFRADTIGSEVDRVLGLTRELKILLFDVDILDLLAVRDKALSSEAEVELRTFFGDLCDKLKDPELVRKMRDSLRGE